MTIGQIGIRGFASLAVAAAVSFGGVAQAAAPAAIQAAPLGARPGAKVDRPAAAAAQAAALKPALATCYELVPVYAPPSDPNQFVGESWATCAASRRPTPRVRRDRA